MLNRISVTYVRLNKYLHYGISVQWKVSKFN